MKRASMVRRASGRVGRDESFGMETLEGRELLAADLAVMWDTANLRIPSVVVPGDRIDPLGGAGRIEVPIIVANQGTTTANGTTRIDFYLSSDTTLNPAQDTLIKTFNGEQVSLDPYTGDPNQLGDFSPDMTIPATVAPGAYFLIARLVPDANIGDFNQSNNVAVTADPINVMRRFGTFSGRANVTMTLQDADGTNVTFLVAGGGYGDVTQMASGFGVTLNGTGNISGVNIGASGGDGVFNFTSVTINGSVGNFTAANGNLHGPMTATVGFGAMLLGDVAGPLTITVPATSQVPSFIFHNVQELSISSPSVGISGIRVNSWTDFDGTADSIRAPYLGQLDSAANFYPSIYLTGSGNANPTLGAVTIGGVIKRGTWSVNGSGGALDIFATTVYWSASYAGAVPSLHTSGSYRGVFTASTIGPITSGRDILLSKILAGAYLGADGVLGGTGPDADTYGPGSIASITAAHNIAGVTIGAGLDPVDGVFRNGNDRIVGGTQSSIGPITITNIAGQVSRVLANTYGAVTIGGNPVDWHFSTRFRLSTFGPVASLTSATVGTFQNAPTATIAVRFMSTSLMSLTSIHSGAIRVTGPNGFVAFGTLATKSFDAATFNRDALATFRVKLANAGETAAGGTYTVSVVDQTATDERGNFAQAITIGSFNVT